MSTRQQIVTLIVLAIPAWAVGLDLASLRNPVWVSKDNLRDPSVLKTDDGYHLFYSRFSAVLDGWTHPRNWHVAEVVTKDFLTFTGDRDVSPEGCASPGDVVRWHGRWILPYQTYPSKPTQLVFSESTNLADWSPPRPLLPEALELPWNRLHRAIDPSLVIEGQTLHCFFVGSASHADAGGRILRANLMGHAVTGDPNLRKWKILTAEKPLIGYSDAAPDGVENTMIFKTGNHWTMIYSEGLEAQHLALATSPDLVQWELCGSIRILRQPWMSRKFGAPFVWFDGDRWLMILMGTDAKDHTTLGLLSSSDGAHWGLLPAR
jgi:sucrose-6-phosphate hydrolase SacC (GH32 family)